MPGIFVRSVGPLDWDEEGKEPVLTVPGSYWLCHKKNIYKFTLKFHKSIRNTAEFNYSKDLMRVIRRILKSNPPQGQQFSTKNLFVEYNHTTWTRPDKMFAMLKFRDKPDAVVYQQAFILTIKIVDLIAPDKILVDDRRLTENSKIGPGRRSERGKSDAEIKTIINIKGISSNVNKISNTNISPKNKDITNRSSKLDDSVSLKLEEELLNKELNINESLSEDDNASNKSLLIEDNSTKCSSSVSNDIQVNFGNCTYSIKNNNEETVERENKDVNPEIEELNNSRLIESSVNKITMDIENDEDMEIDVDGDVDDSENINLRLERSEDDETDIDEDIDVCGNSSTDDIEVTDGTTFEHEDVKNENTKLSNEEDIDIDVDVDDSECDLERSISGVDLTESEYNCFNKETEDIQVDSTCVPYQYLIERDIENSRIKCIQKSREINGDSSSQSYHLEDVAASEVPEDTVEMQCLDMTEQVMKGLMFTLKQEKDSVKIVKQTTKVEVDEVLENSEKVETKEGDPCLLNSSLLKLESMITNIDNRSKSHSDLNKLYESLASLVTEKDGLNAERGEDALNETSKLHGLRFEQAPPNLRDNMIVTPTNAMENIEIKGGDVDVVVGIEEEDIIPEAFQRNLMEVEKPEEYAGLLMDDFEETVTRKTFVNKNEEDTDINEGEKSSDSNECTNNGSKLNIINKNVTPKINGPKVISDEIIRKNDLPPSLLSMLNNTKATTKRIDVKSTGNLHFDAKSNSDINNGLSEKKDKQFESTSEFNLIKSPITKLKSEVESEHMIEDKAEFSDICTSIQINDKFGTPNNSVSTECDKNLMYNKSRTSTEGNENIDVKEKSDINKQEDITGSDKILKVENAKKSVDRSHVYPTMPQKRYPTREIKETNQPVYVFNRKRSRLDDQKNDEQKCKRKPSYRAKKQVNLCKLIEDLAKGAKVVIERLDPKLIPS